jgi:hypothetical protein
LHPLIERMPAFIVPRINAAAQVFLFWPFSRLLFLAGLIDLAWTEMTDDRWGRG